MTENEFIGRGILVRAAKPADAGQICAIVRASIVELCGADHSNDPAILERWLENKTPETVVRWIENPRNRNLVAVTGDQVLAAGCVTISGEIILNYVAPNARFQGVSNRILGALIAEIKNRGIKLCNLESTTTARRFYRDRGFVDSGPPSIKFGLTTWPMTKQI